MRYSANVIREGLLFESTDGRSRFLVELGGEVVVGRAPPDPSRDVRAPWAVVSRTHVAIANLGAPGGACVVKDAGSAGGAYVDGRRVAGDMPITPGAALELASGAVYRTRTFRGGSLAEALRSGPMPAHRVVAMARDLLIALTPLHDADGAHGALTPEEILVGDNGTFVVLTRGWPMVDASGALLGNPRYVAPELFASERTRTADAATDAYSLACIVYEALNGAGPFTVETAQANIIAKLQGQTPRVDPSWPDALRDWLTRALACRPEERPKTRDAIAMLGAVSAQPRPDPVSAALADICAELTIVASKWSGIREAYAMGGGDDYDWAKGNGRWALGASYDVAQLRAETFPSIGALLDSVESLLSGRGWDGDYDEPKNARDEMLAAVGAVRARVTLRPSR